MDIPEIGESVTITGGSYAGFKGVVAAGDAGRQVVTVEVSIFGRLTAVEVSRAQLQSCAPLAPEALAVLRERLHSDDEAAISAAADEIGTIGARASATQGDLETLLGDRRAAVRQAAVAALGAVSAGRSAALLAATDDRSSKVVAAALLALKHQGRQADDGAQRIARAKLTDRHARVQEAAVAALMAFMSPDSDDALLSVIDDGATLQVRTMAALASARIGGRSSAIPPLVRLAEDLRSDPRRRDTAHYALGRIGAAEALVEMLDEPDPIWRTHAAVALCQCATDARIPTIIDVLRSVPEEWQRRAILKGLVSCEADITAGLPALIALAPADALRSEVFDVLSVHAAAPALVTLAAHPDEPVRAAALHSLARGYRLDPGLILPALLDGLRSDSARCRRSAARGLGRSLDHVGVREALLEAQSAEPDDRTREAITGALGES